MATHDEKIAAAHASLQAIGVLDPDEAERFVATFWSQADLLPVTTEPSVIAALEARIAKLEADSAVAFGVGIRIAPPTGPETVRTAQALRDLAETLEG